MTGRENADVATTAANLRQTFDSAFAQPPARPSGDVEDVLLIRVANEGYCIRLSAIAAIVARRPVVPLPSALSGLLGLVGIRGEIVPVFSLASILGYSDDAGDPNWMVLCRGGEPVALGFSAMDGYVRLPRSSFHETKPAESRPREYADHLVSVDAEVRPALSIQRIVVAISNQSGDSLQ